MPGTDTLAMPNIEFDPEKAAKGGLSAVIDVQGTLVKHTRIANKFGATRKKFGTEDEEAAPDQIQVDLEDVVIIEMEEGAEEPELENGEFTILINYAKPGQPKSNALSQWNSGYADSCKKVWGKLPNEMEGQTVRLRKGPRQLVMKDRKTNEEKIIDTTRWQFVALDAEGPNVEEKAKALIMGKKQSVALRAVMTDPLLRSKPEYKEAVTAGAPLLGLELVEGIYVPQAE